MQERRRKTTQIPWIGLSGWAGSGKDEVGKILVRDYAFTRFAFADILKEALALLDPQVECQYGVCNLSRLLVWSGGWDVAKQEPDVRRLLQLLGTEVGRGLLGEQVWIDATMKRIHDSGVESAVITDCRFVNEAEAIWGAGGTMWRVERPGVQPANGHRSEIALDDYLEYFDAVIANVGDLDDLAVTVGTAVEQAGIL